MTNLTRFQKSCLGYLIASVLDNNKCELPFSMLECKIKGMFSLFPSYKALGKNKKGRG